MQDAKAKTSVSSRSNTDIFFTIITASKKRVRRVVFRAEMRRQPVELDNIIPSSIVTVDVRGADAKGGQWTLITKLGKGIKRQRARAEAWKGIVTMFNKRAIEKAHPGRLADGMCLFAL